MDELTPAMKLVSEATQIPGFQQKALDWFANTSDRDLNMMRGLAGVLMNSEEAQNIKLPRTYDMLPTNVHNLYAGICVVQDYRSYMSRYESFQKLWPLATASEKEALALKLRFEANQEKLALGEVPQVRTLNQLKLPTL